MGETGWRGGICYLCEKRIAKDERPVLFKSGRRPEYMHVECARELAVGHLSPHDPPHEPEVEPGREKRDS